MSIFNHLKLVLMSSMKTLDGSQQALTRSEFQQALTLNEFQQALKLNEFQQATLVTIILMAIFTQVVVVLSLVLSTWVFHRRRIL